MNQVKFSGANDVLSRPAGTSEEECGDLIIHRGTDPELRNYPVITSCWEMSEEEKEEFVKTGKVYFRSWGSSHAPISLSVFNPVEHGWVQDANPLQPNHPSLNS